MREQTQLAILAGQTKMGCIDGESKKNSLNCDERGEGLGGWLWTEGINVLKINCLKFLKSIKKLFKYCDFFMD